MNNDDLRQTISDFSGNIQSAFSLLQEVHRDLNFDLDFNFNSSNANQRFTNLVRNMISRGLIQRPSKSGRSLILDERILLELIVARKYISAGCSMQSLSGYLAEISTDQLYERLFVNRLPDIDEVAHRPSQFLRDIEHKQEAKRGTDSTDEVSIAMNLFHQIKVGNGLFLHVQQGKFSKTDISAMIRDLNKYVTSRRKKRSD